MTRAFDAAQYARDHSEPEADADECGPCSSCDKKRWCEKWAEARIDEAEYERGYR